MNFKKELLTSLPKPVKILLLAVIIIAVICVGFAFKKGQEHQQTQQLIAGNLEQLQKLGDQDPSSIESQIKQINGLGGSNGTALSGDDEIAMDEESQAKEREKIMTMENPDKTSFNTRFDGCALLGDSIAEDAGGYGFLNDSILFAKIGCCVSQAGELKDRMVNMYPEKIFIAFGSNDIDNYGQDVDRFINNYKEFLDDIHAKLPNAQVYVVAVLPIIKPESKGALVPTYNEALQKLCDERGLPFIDPGFILNEEPSFYEPDGEHVGPSFYYKWLTYIGDMGGLD